MIIKKNLIMVIPLLLLVGCSSVPPIDFSVKNISVIENRKDADLRSITVDYDSNLQQTTAQGLFEIPLNWKASLEAALNSSLAFKDNAPLKVNLTVRIVELYSPGIGTSMTTKIGAKYEISNRETGELLFSDIVESNSTVPFSYALDGLTRWKESVNRSVRANIRDFIKRLDYIELVK